MPTRTEPEAAAPAPASVRGHAILTSEQWAALATALRISPRELQIVHGVFDDLKEAAIADNLGISAHTVHTHLERLYRKLSVCGRCPLVVRIFQEHLALSTRQSGRAES
ncbi:MAG: LuxR C-terminal-related transcriptional regulator [Planctomycetota bacterium]|nr:LuxR C-terminal-related transcriptional regulator [Planctomycetota bacterium]